MGVVDDVFKAMERIPVWRRMQEIPREVDDLTKRVTELEEKLSGKWPADVCRHCGARAARLGNSSVERGVVTERWDCAECHHMDFRYRKP